MNRRGQTIYASVPPTGRRSRKNFLLIAFELEESRHGLVLLQAFDRSDEIDNVVRLQRLGSNSVGVIIRTAFSNNFDGKGRRQGAPELPDVIDLANSVLGVSPDLRS
jgi:hypothetical protein